MNPPRDRPESHGADHAELEGSHEPYRYRPQRVPATELAFRPTCRFRLDGEFTAAREVLDLSPNGIAIVPSERAPLQAGQLIEQVHLEHCNNEIWSGPAEVVYRQSDGERVGLRFTTGELNMQSLNFRDRLIERRLVRSLYRVLHDDSQLPAEWRAGVSTTRGLLEAAKTVMDEMEGDEPAEPWQMSAARKRELCEMVYQKWWPAYRDQLVAMESLSEQLPAQAREAAMEYVAHELMPLLRECPMHSRAYDKPLGYAGDYQLMLLGNGEELAGESLYGCLLHHTVQNFDLGRAIVARCDTAGRRVADMIRPDGRTRIVSLASGPALELQELIRTLPTLHHPLELILVDVDEQAIRHAHDALLRERNRRGEDGRLIELNCLQFSISQIMTPVDEHERRLVDEVLGDVDMVYSMGLFDYLTRPVAVRLLRRLYGMLKPGGRLFVGNLKRAPGCSWAMDYAVHWQLIYRDEQEMHDLGERMRQSEARFNVEHDPTGFCMFLDVERPR